MSTGLKRFEVVGAESGQHWDYIYATDEMDARRRAAVIFPMTVDDGRPYKILRAECPRCGSFQAGGQSCGCNDNGSE